MRRHLGKGMREIIRARRGALNRLALAFLTLSFASCAGLAPSRMEEPPSFGEYGIDYSLEIRSSPRPLRIHVAVADMAGGRLRLVTPIASPGADPRGGEAALEDPLREARKLSSLLLVNASAFSVHGFEPGARPIAYLRGMRADIAGLAVHEGAQASPEQEGFAALRVDGDGPNRRWLWTRGGHRGGRGLLDARRGREADGRRGRAARRAHGHRRGRGRANHFRGSRGRAQGRERGARASGNWRASCWSRAPNGP